jgi:uncharacterized protein YjbI with pentapeptide repeats
MDFFSFFVFLLELHLSFFHLEGIFMSRANLEKAILGMIHPEEAFLNETNLKFAYLGGAELKGANLEPIRKVL